MGYIAHDAVVILTWQRAGHEQPDLEAFRASMPERLRPLVIGPISTPVNGYLIYAFLPDGSKEGWDDSEAGDEWRGNFRALFTSRGDLWPDGVSVRFGGDFGAEFDSPIAEAVSAPGQP